LTVYSVHAHQKSPPTYIAISVRTAHKQKRARDHIDDQPNGRDQIGRQPERHLLDQPAPERLDARRILVLVQVLQLRLGQHARHLGQLVDHLALGLGELLAYVVLVHGVVELFGGGAARAVAGGG